MHILSHAWQKRLLGLLGVVFFVMLCTVSAAHADERILNFNVSYEVLPDASVEVVETIVYDFGAEERHGIYRTILRNFTDTSGVSHEIDVSVRSVSDENGNPYLWQEEGSNDIFNLRIGDPASFVRGTQTYVVAYTLTNALAYLDDRVELYWNVTGNEWEIPIDSVHASVVVPEMNNLGMPATTTIVGYACYQGIIGSSESCISGANNSLVIFSSGRALSPGEGMTVAVGFPKDRVTEPSGILISIKKFLERFDLAITALLPVLSFFFFFNIWRTRGRDPKKRSVTVPEYDAPKDLSVMEAAYLMNTSIEPQDIAAAIVSLAVRGAVQISKKESTVLLFFKDTDYVLTRTTAPVSLGADERALLDALFSHANGAEAGVLSLDKADKKSMVAALAAVKKQTIQTLVDKKYVTRVPYASSEVFPFLKVLGVATIFVIGIYILTSGSYTWIGLLVSYVMGIAFLGLMPQKTILGASVVDTLRGLKLYINVAEKARIEFHNAPEKTTELFEKLLPYAMLFGLTEIWTKEFGDLLKEPPDWYSGGSASWAPAALATDLSGFGTSFAHAAAPQGSGSSSGSGGGGFSGGGGGGGGGGSW